MMRLLRFQVEIPRTPRRGFKKGKPCNSSTRKMVGWAVEKITVSETVASTETENEAIVVERRRPRGLAIVKIIFRYTLDPDTFTKLILRTLLILLQS